MSHAFYLVMHIAGIFLVLMSLAGIGVHLINGGGPVFPMRKKLAALHGTGLLIALVGGFGLLARLGLMSEGLPIWAWSKLFIWLILGAMPALFFRQAKKATLWLILVYVLAVSAGLLAAFKPF